jgi:putative transcriptional regulator
MDGVPDSPSPRLRGRLLVATPVLAGPPFERSVVAILDHSDTGALGVVLNHPGQTPVGAVVPAVSELVVAPDVLFDGGPVATGSAIALGTTSHGARRSGWMPLSPPLVSVDLDHDPSELAASVRQLRVFAGYAGWSPGQLEAEIAEGAWWVTDLLPSDVFDPQPGDLWRRVLRRQPWPLCAVATYPPDPALN